MIQKTKKILLPLDFSDQSLIALEQSCSIAKKYNAELTLLHVIEDHGSLAKFFTKELHTEIKEHLQDQLDKLAKDIESKTKITVNTLIARGKVYEKIIEFSESINATKIVMGTNGDITLKKKFIGTNAIRVVRESKIPVITIKGKKHRKSIENIVLPLDLSKETKEKVGTAITLSKMFDNAVLRVVSVLFTSDEFVVNRLTRQLGQVKSFLEKQGVECSAEIVKGVKGEESLAESILEYSEKVDGDLIMIMTQQELDFTHLFVGSSAQEIINHSTIPVMSIRPATRLDMTEFPYPY